MSDQPLTELERQLPAHLGGHFGRVNKDPAVLRYLVDRYDIETMIDVGCGPGGMLDEAIAMGVIALGIDGDPFVCEEDRRIVCHDYTTGPFTHVSCGLAWCVEMLEHLDPVYLGNVFATFAAARVLFITAAPPGQVGHHHVNCQPESYWRNQFTARGWQVDPDATAWVRQHGDHYFSRRQGLVFVRGDQ